MHVQSFDRLTDLRPRPRAWRPLLSFTAAAYLMMFAPARAEAPAVTVEYQPMVSTGLAASQPFEAWFVFDKSSDPRVPGYAIPAGATIRFAFPKEFTPQADLFQGAVMLYGWPQGPIPAKFATTQDEADPRTLIVRFDEPIGVAAPDKPGLKAIHLRVRVLNPATSGDYPITVDFANAGALSGIAKSIAHITAKAVPNVAAYNQLNQGRGSNWQRVKAGQEAPVPIDFLVTIPDVPRSVVSLKPLADGSLAILSDGKPAGSIRTHGAPVTLAPESFGPGYSRVGIIRVRAKAGSQPGLAQIVAALDGGTQYTINLIVE
jgi:hypothetical protein